MLDISHTLINKLVLKIDRNDSLSPSISAADMVKGILYDKLTEIYHLTSEWKYFAKGGKIASEDEILKGQIASITLDKVHSWAAYLNIKDPASPRRRWVYYIGIRADHEDSCTLFYAKCCYDHLVGSIQEAKPIPHEFDPIPESLLVNSHIRCMCGTGILPNKAVELTHSTLPDLLNLLTDKSRKQPVFLITCSQYLSPEKIAGMLRGNAVVFWTENSSTVMRLNSMLPQNKYTVWESVHIFMPDSGDATFHPVHTLNDIQSMGVEKYYAALRQAYCQSMRSEERREFPTIDYIISARNRQLIESLLQQVSEKDTKLATVIGQNRDLRKANENLEKENQRLSDITPTEEAVVYEGMLNESMKDIAALRHAIQHLNTLLCSDMGMTFCPDQVETIAIVQELAHTIYACLQRASEKK